ncbi:hypothetical protein GIY30_02240 [Gordonia sp. HNM0687]|uniref:Uncharacterized protein n=1 Tax=Gordonia mangrovi TaxID=2665643 RepID=A0A6L7GJR3_9ACTN|nr:hypothetical protein [Gordonia mangrovi]MXP20190.1 hypothetical protein [Gordonia mangrovi]UVF79203.1 hypothetical protein NWF22_05000 [Gordonia mangrovi]
MKFNGLPPGAEDLPQGRPQRRGPAPRVPSPRIATPRIQAPTPTRPSLLGDIGRVGLLWFGSLIPLAFITQVFAGSSFSPGQGGGFRELLTWVIVFGVITLGIVAERHTHSRSDALTDLTRTGAMFGFLVGVVVAVVWFSMKGGPEPGNWFVGPAFAAAGAAVSLYTGTTRGR